MLTAAQRTMRDRYSAIGFTITERPFAGTDRTKWYFANRPDSDERRSDFTVNLDSGICHQMGTNQLRSIDEAESEFGDVTGKVSGNSDGRSQKAESQLGGLTPPRSPVKVVKTDKPAKKKQAALF
jgi:hypothetical protein